MSVQRWTADGYGAQQGEMMPDPEGPWMLAADHARIVAEAGAAVFAFHPEWTVTGMCDPDCLACRRLTELITEREKGYEEGKADAEQAHAAALAAARAEGFESAHNEWAKALPEHLRVDRLLRAPRTLTADDPEPAVGSVVLFDGLPYIRQGNKWVAPRANIAYWYEFMRDERPTVLIHDGEDRYSRLGREASETMTAMDARRAAIHDGEATPEVKPCSTCGEPVAYLTARTGWAGGWLHHPARPLDGHPAAIDGEATR